MTSVRIAITDSNVAFTGAILIISLDLARDCMSAFRVAIFSEWELVSEGASPTAQGSGVAIVWSSGQ